MMRRFYTGKSAAFMLRASVAPPLVSARVFQSHGTFNSKKKEVLLAPRPVSFNDSAVFADRSLYYLIKSLVVLKICGIEAVSKNCVKICKMCEKVFGRTFTYFVVKRTFYSVFCAGENDAELKKSIKLLDSKNIGAVLDYAAEADEEGFTPVPGAEQAPDVSMSSLVKKTNIVYHCDEEAFDDTMKLYMMSTMHATIHCPRGGQGLIATKVSGMCDTQLLARISAILLSIHQSWSKYFTTTGVPKLEECRHALGGDEKECVCISLKEMEEGFMRYYPNDKLSPQGIKEILALLDADGDGLVDFYTYKEVMSQALLSINPTPTEQELVDRLPQLTAEEKEMWRNTYNRVRSIALTAANVNVRVMIDAEQTFYQPAIDALTLVLQKEFNKTVPVVQNTYQCYLTYARDRVFDDIQTAKKHNFMWGGKIVRGAYMIQERKTAQEYGYQDPIWPTLQGTHNCYLSTAELIFKEMAENPKLHYEAFFGTHNKEALEKLTGQVLQLPADTQKRVFFGQLLGMRDNLTIPLANNGYRVYKYVPYGPVRETIYYLGRRAVENSSILKAGDTDETRFMKGEIYRRFHLKK